MAKMLEFILHNFTHAAPILTAGALGMIIIIERMRALIWSYPFPYADAFFEKIRNMIMADRIGEAIAFCERFRAKPVANVVREGLVRAHQPEELISHGLQLAVGQATEKVTSRTNFLSTIANVATLLGLLGTIVGLIQSFEAVGNANAQQRSALLAAGISTAMNATMLGLGVAIPCMVFFSYLMARTNKLVAQIEQAGIRTMDLLQQRYYSAEMDQEVPAPQPAPTPVNATASSGLSQSSYRGRRVR